MEMKPMLESRINIKSEIKMGLKSGLIFCTPYGIYKCANDKDFIKNHSSLIERIFLQLLPQYLIYNMLSWEKIFYGIILSKSSSPHPFNFIITDVAFFVDNCQKQVLFC